jgi:hypothetical protein
MPALSTCPECGARGRFASCAELFGRLLALDHERRQPWGAFHSVNVACYLVQHPSQTSPAARAGQWQIVTTFVADGLDAVHQLTAERVRQNRRGTPRWSEGKAPEGHRSGGVTIEDVAVDGTFPADGYEQRMRLWAESIVAARS